jgi:maltokinase
MAPPDLARLDEERLGEWLLGRRWFGSKAEDVSQVHVLDAMTLAGGPPALELALVEARFPTGAHAIYQLLLGTRPADEGWEQERLDDIDGETVYEALADPEVAGAFGRLLADEATVTGERATVTFHWLDTFAPPAPDASVRAMGAEQSNSSLVFDDALVLKAFRRLEAGDNPELEMLRFLSGRDFPNIAELAGWADYEGELMDATLAVVQRFVPGGRDGWELALDEIGSDPETFVARMSELGAVIGRMHTVLGSDAGDPAFAPEEPSMESTSLITATIDEQIERLFVDLPADNEGLEPIIGRGEEVRDRLSLLTHIGASGKLIRHHGDLHLGQTLLAPDRWIVLDFEGEPARPLAERTTLMSPLRDVAGMLRSFDYAARHLLADRPDSAQLVYRAVEWADRNRDAFCDGYAEESGRDPRDQAVLLRAFELDKAVYEVRYEASHRPSWLSIPLAGIERIVSV